MFLLKNTKKAKNKTNMKKSLKLCTRSLKWLSKNKEARDASVGSSN